MWADLNELMKAISMSGKERSRQRVKSFINELNQGTASLTGEEIATLKRMIVERRARDTAHVTVAPIDTPQTCSPQSRSPEMSFDIRPYMERNDEGRMDPERGQLEQSSGWYGSARTIIGWYESARTIIGWYGSARITIGWYGF